MATEKEIKKAVMDKLVEILQDKYHTILEDDGTFTIPPDATDKKLDTINMLVYEYEKARDGKDKT